MNRFMPFYCGGFHRPKRAPAPRNGQSGIRGELSKALLSLLLCDPCNMCRVREGCGSPFWLGILWNHMKEPARQVPCVAGYEQKEKRERD